MGLFKVPVPDSIAPVGAQSAAVGQLGPMTFPGCVSEVVWTAVSRQLRTILILSLKFLSGTMPWGIGSESCGGRPRPQTAHGSSRPAAVTEASVDRHAVPAETRHAPGGWQGPQARV